MMKKKIVLLSIISLFMLISFSEKKLKILIIGDSISIEYKLLGNKISDFLNKEIN